MLLLVTAATDIHGRA